MSRRTIELQLGSTAADVIEQLSKAADQDAVVVVRNQGTVHEVTGVEDQDNGTFRILTRQVVDLH